MKKHRTAGEASRLLAEYEHLNSDLPRETRRLLGAFALATRVPIAELEELFNQNFGRTLQRHRSWFWYNTMLTSGIDYLWDHFAAKRNAGVPMRDCLIDLRECCSEDDWETFSNRHGVVIFKDSERLLNPHWWNDRGSTQRIWTRGGTWDRRNNFTKIIVLGETLERDYDYNQFARKLGPHGCALLEREIHHTISEEELLFSEAVHRATDYARERIPQLAGIFEERKASFPTVSWFFQTAVPKGEGRLIDYSEYGRATLRSHKYDWFPSGSSEE